MRNIAILEWGPASLYYIQPRRTIKVRTPWLDGGPLMPPFLSTKDEAKTQGFRVRYALSAFENLDNVIKNIRHCFGFPYQEAIGYLNSLTRSHRVRREHEALIDRLRQWAIFGNVDAVVWIDYEKSNQKPGSFKVGPRNSRPFSRAHIELCTTPSGRLAREEEEDDGSDWTGSDVEEPSPKAGEAIPSSARGPRSSALLKHFSSARKKQRGLEAAGGVSVESPKGSKAPAEARKTTETTPRASGDAPLVDHDEISLSLDSARDSQTSAQKQKADMLLDMMIQEEVVPAHGSIYPRSIAPGPGHYGNPYCAMAPGSRGKTFGRKAIGRIDETVKIAKLRPGPGEYHTGMLVTRPTDRPTDKPTDRTAPFGRFGKAAKMVLPVEGQNSMPFISDLAHTHDSHGVHSPNTLHLIATSACDSAQGKMTAPLFSFGKARRPF
eukprot:gnl/MRDRNA2_/MRDRNA2_105659_c0_seq1.p1 gnl/MRDRNA2_/MRDRNA2_105659_c0~~gnl/MRDRNA2_/MRDRNA2_105659_c0_seq1.p1  ORF type:complete len:437 (+),score=55.15 gnl/MRDRNA2_/MRDRNA2_105659_c0_seq1:143-1453(+)